MIPLWKMYTWDKVIFSNFDISYFRGTVYPAFSIFCSFEDFHVCCTLYDVCEENTCYNYGLVYKI